MAMMVVGTLEVECDHASDAYTSYCYRIQSRDRY